MTELEGTIIPPEGTKEATQEKETPTLKYSEEDYERAVSKGVSKGLESTQRQLDLRQGEVQKLTAEVEQHKAEIATRDARIQAMQKEVDEALADDPEKRDSYISRIAGLEREQKIAKKDAEAAEKLYKAELMLWQAGMGLKAQELDAEFPSLNLNMKELINTSATEEEMENKVLRLASKQEPEKPPKFESGVSSGGGLPLHPTLEQLEKMDQATYAKWWKERQKPE